MGKRPRISKHQGRVRVAVKGITPPRTRSRVQCLPMVDKAPGVSVWPHGFNTASVSIDTDGELPGGYDGHVVQATPACSFITSLHRKARLNLAFLFLAR